MPRPARHTRSDMTRRSSFVDGSDWRRCDQLEPRRLDRREQNRFFLPDSPSNDGSVGTLRASEASPSHFV